MTERLSRLTTPTLLGLAFAIPAAVLTAALLGYPAYLTRSFVARESRRHADLLARPIAGAAGRALREGATIALQRLLEETGADPSVKSASLVGSDGLIVASSRRDWVGRDEAVIEDAGYRRSAAAARATRERQQAPAGNGERLLRVEPLPLAPSAAPGGGGAAAGPPLLVLQIDYDEPLGAMVASLLERGALAAVGIMLVNLLLFAWTRARLTRPIAQVAAHLRGLAAGETSEPPRPTGPREVSDLMRDVARMAGELRAQKGLLLESESQLRQAQRMESVASLAGAMAHDFNNLLTAILGYARLVLDRVGPGDPIRRQVAAIETSAARAADLTGQLLTFSRRATSRPSPADLRQTLAPTIETVRAGLPPDVALEVECAADLWATSVDEGQIRRVATALCTNALEATKVSGRITIRLRNETLTDADCRGRIEARPGRFVSLSVADTGPGVAPEMRERLFEPFVTTKKGSSSAGFGLATAYGLVKGHDGWIEMRSEPGRGATFTVFLPKSDAPAGTRRTESVLGPPARAGDGAALGATTSIAAAAVSEPAAASDARAAGAPAAAPAAAGASRESRTILVVDDEPAILALTRDVLEIHGYAVLTARNGEEALRTYRERQGRIDLVLLDLTMPLMGGLECFRRMKEADPGVAVVISSGFSSESSAEEVLREGALDYLQKPYDIEHLARTVAAALSRSRATGESGGARPIARAAGAPL